MHTPYPTLLLLGFLALLSACAGMEQEVWVNADGSGRTRMGFDASEMLPMLTMPDGPGDPAGTGAPAEKIVELLGRDRVDTTFLLADVIGDEILAAMQEPASLEEELGREVTDGLRDTMALAYEVMQRTRLSIDLDRPAGRLGMAVIGAFDDVRGADYSGVLDKDIARRFQGGVGSGVNPAAGNTSELLLRLDGDRLDVRVPTSAVAEALAEQLRQQSGGTAEVGPEEAVAMLSMMGMETYPLVLHVPGKVTGVEAPGAHAVTADNAVRLEVDYAALARERVDYEASVRFKPKRKYRVLTD